MLRATSGDVEIRAGLVAVVLAIAICPSLSAQTPHQSPVETSARATAGSSISFQLVDGVANLSTPILDARKASIREKRGGTLQSHDWWLWGLTAIDYDRDGDPDFLVTIHGPSHGLILKNLFVETGKLTFVNVTTELGVDGLLPGASGRKPFVWDFNGDGWLDIVGLNTPHLINEGGKKFVPTEKKAPWDSFDPQAIVDLNGDGYPDILNNTSQTAMWNVEKKTFDNRPFLEPLLTKLPEPVTKFLEEAKAKPTNRFLRLKLRPTTGIFGQDTSQYLLSGYASYGGDAIGRYLQPDAGGNLLDKTEEMHLPTSGTPILCRDLDVDGAPDLLIAASKESGFYRNNGQGRFQLQAGPLTDRLRIRDPYLHRAEVVDFNGDGLPDLVVTLPRGGQTAVYENRGEGKFEPVLQQRGWDADPVVICDVNRDGLPDIVVGGPANQVTLLINTTNKPGNICRLSPRLPAPNLNAVGTKIEIFAVGTLMQSGARPKQVESANIDGTPIYVGLGSATAFDLRVTFPAQNAGDTLPREWKYVTAEKDLQVTPAGVQAAATRLLP